MRGGVDRVLRVDEKDGVAVGGRLGDDLGRERAARSRAVLDDDGLAKALPEALGEQAGDEVRRRSRRQRQDQADGLRRNEPACGALAAWACTAPTNTPNKPAQMARRVNMADVSSWLKSG